VLHAVGDKIRFNIEDSHTVTRGGAPLNGASASPICSTHFITSTGWWPNVKWMERESTGVGDMNPRSPATWRNSEIITTGASPGMSGFVPQPGQCLDTAIAASRAGKASSMATNHSLCSPMYGIGSSRQPCMKKWRPSCQLKTPVPGWSTSDS
jgi:hypothetical protein